MPTVINAENLPTIVDLFKNTIEPISKQLEYEEFKARMLKFKFEQQLPVEVQSILKLDDKAISAGQQEQVFAAAINIAMQQLEQLDLTAKPQAVLETINTIGQIFCLRTASKERSQVEESEEVKKLFAYTKYVMNGLGFVQAIYPPKGKPCDIAIVFGGYQFRVEERDRFRVALEREGYKFKRLAFFGGARPLEKDKERALESLESLRAEGNDPRHPAVRSEPFSEFDMMKLVYQVGEIDLPAENITEFNTDDILAERGYPKATPKRSRKTYVHSIKLADGQLVEFENGPELIGADGRATRPTTQSTVEDYLAYLLVQGIDVATARLQVCTISMQPHVLYQASVAEASLPLQFTIYPAGAALGFTNTSDMLDSFARYVYQELAKFKLHAKLAAASAVRKPMPALLPAAAAAVGKQSDESALRTQEAQKAADGVDVIASSEKKPNPFKLAV